MKYPYIGKGNFDGTVFLMLKSGNGIVIKADGVTAYEVGDIEYDMIEDCIRNITPEYLANTFGEVVSPEHAEFIIELCRTNGVQTIYSSSAMDAKSFEIGGSNISLYSFGINGMLNLDNKKKITIPLPPKQTQTATPEEEFEMEQIMKNAGDNLVLGCEDSKCDEWPCVGDEVLVCPNSRRLMEIRGKVVKVIGKCTHSDGSTIITVEHSSLGVFAVANGSWIKKPKTPEEELRDDLIEYLNELGSSARYCFGGNELAADELLKSYNITKKPQ